MRHLVVLISALSILATPSASTAEPYGRADYMQYCSACHGEAADGHGPVAGVLDPGPADLRHLHAKYGSPLGTDLVVYVLGEKMPRAHGTSDMPVWGRNLRGAEGQGERESAQIIWRIVNYLESIQPGSADK